jgi:hypothetical protein
MKRLFALAIALGACGPELNPARPPPSRDDLGNGVWVAYNLGCQVGCDEIKRGDRILAVDGRPVESGAEVDAIGLARGAPLKLSVARYRTGELREITIVAEPNDALTPIPAVSPLFTVGAAALDQAPEWARRKLFGHAIPALRFYRLDEPRGYVNGRELYGRGAVIVIWEYPAYIKERERNFALIPGVYAHLQEYADQLAELGVDAYFIFDNIKGEPRVRDWARSNASPGPNGFIPTWQLASSPRDPNTLGIENPAADIRESILDGWAAPAIIVIDRRGIVRFHTVGFPLGPHDTMAVAIDFALKALPDVPAQPNL